MAPLDGLEGNAAQPSELYAHTGSGMSTFSIGVERYLRKLKSGFENIFWGNPLYPLLLIGKAPRRLEVIPADPWPGNYERGRAILENGFTFQGTTLHSETAPWNAPGMSPHWLAELHGFTWLRDLRLIGSDMARRRGRELVLDWITTNRSWHPIGWRADVLGRRLAAWAGHGEFLCTGAEDGFRSVFLASLARQVRHLCRAAPGHLRGPARIAVAKGLIYTGAAIANHESYLESGLEILEKELPRQVYSDGGHILRSPAIQLAVLRDLAEIRSLLLSTHREVPKVLQSTTDRMGAMLRFFRHGDGGLALFNGAHEEESWLIDMTLGRADAKGNPPESAPYTGFERLVAGRTLVLFDTGVPEPAVSGLHQSHAGTLSFEMSSGKERLVVNSGAYTGNKDEWRTAVRSTAAHSTVTIDDMNSSEIHSDGRIGRRPRKVTCRRDERDGDIWVEGSHDGYREPFGLMHRRRLYLSADGEDLRGEDRLEGLGGSRFDIRFHLHPQVSASLSRDGFTVLLRLPKGGGWKFQAIGGVIRLEKSAYLGDWRKMHRSEQIVVSGPLEGSAARVKWAFKRIPSHKSA
ncbi:MAG: heparinase II/III family protein [Alphaproteobacteria bacterium]